jgi:hypothetical protein
MRQRVSWGRARRRCARSQRPATRSALTHFPLVRSTPSVELSLGAAHKEVAKALVEALGAPDATDASVLAALREKSTALAAKLLAMLPAGVPLGVPAAALGAGPFAGSAGGGDLVRAFKDTLVAQGLGAGVGSPAVEGFLWGVAAAEPALQRAASEALRGEIERAKAGGV